jgi:[ribosomal protein S5]-alanine N-acetyltransferase
MHQDSESPNILLNSKRLFLRRVENDDLELLKKLFCDPEMMRYLGRAWTLDFVTETMLEWHNEWGKNNYYYGVLVRKDTSEAVGIAGFTENTIPEEAGIEFTWFIVPEQQKKGYATEVTQAILAYAFEQTKMDRVLAETHPENIASKRVLEKSFFRNIGDRNNQYDFLPDFKNQVLWEFKRVDWKGRKKDTV